MVGPPPRSTSTSGPNGRPPRGFRPDDWLSMAVLICGALAVLVFAFRLFSH